MYKLNEMRKQNMNQNEINEFFADNETVGIKSFKFEKALKPLDDVFDGFGEDDNTNLKRFNKLSTVDKHKVLNLEIFSHSYDLDDIRISVVKDNATDTFVIFYNVYKEDIHNYSGFIEIDTDEDIATAIVTEILDGGNVEVDFEAVKEKAIYE